MNQNLTRHFRCETNSCMRFLKEKVVVPCGSSFRNTTGRHHCHSTDLLWASWYMARLSLVGEEEGKSWRDPCHHTRRKGEVLFNFLIRKKWGFYGKKIVFVSESEGLQLCYAGAQVLGRLIYGKGRQKRQLEILAQQKEIKDLGGIHFTKL